MEIEFSKTYVLTVVKMLRDLLKYVADNEDRLFFWI
jgi:hypothetical protein